MNILCEQDCIRLDNLLGDISADLTMYKQLYMQKDSLEILNGTGAMVFSRLQVHLLNASYLSISKLLDPARTRKNKNFSFLYFIEKAGLDDDQEVNELLERAVKVYEESELKNYRNKVLAHNDYRSVSNSPFYPFQIETMSTMLDILWKLWCLIQYRSGRKDSVVDMGLDVILPGDICGSSLLHKLRERT
ncbi:TPA: hypothetical protein NKS71_003540 [Vibrio parahaemolyticus]|uniref:AbiU2 domain-containing protein n=1 Tax=Vibrio harveyi group TaxID=717610 RepID=UPI001123003F|nr:MULTISPECIES: hypothetical protein [Vibrio harveyi group]MBS9926381.1 hypothetical protein [Vibrio alginolyticus]TOG04872.1 hypothetical protein CGJ09_23335 [Vibrio parahaemolyticus]HCE2075693.1 hypothetical protein [Vibrio parahaemolyticus]HCE2191055.1 hypothetical protein [Vibrio parahaemolyticus]HCH2582301.1 hypothetical protein [Vibrio parahaemolyticus]